MELELPFAKQVEVRRHAINDKRNFVGGYYIDSPLCEEVIDYFESKPETHYKGVTGQGVVESVKKSTDMNLYDHNLDLTSRYVDEILQPAIDMYVEEYPVLNDMARFENTPIVQVQRYYPGEGYYRWHAERMSHHQAYRLLTYITYLNDVKEGGGTEFEYQGEQVQAERGLTIIFPGEWTHVHRGIVAPKETKYIMTGWLNFVIEEGEE